MPGYISEIDYYGGASVEWVEIAIPTGTDVSSYSLVMYTSSGYVDVSLSLGTVQSTAGGHDVYLVNAATPGWPGLDQGEGVALVDDTGTVQQFLSYKGFTVTAQDGPAAGTTSVNAGSGAEEEGRSLQTDDGGASYYVQTAPNPGSIPPCYAPGTLIDTPDGPRAVETLRPGDLVMTLDHGPQAIRWIHSGDHPLEGAEDDAKPVLIKAGALGRNLPAQDLIVSQQHRILVGRAGHLQQVFADEAFAPAKALTAAPGIRHMKGKAQITWIHFACDRHEVVTANGWLSESLLLGAMVVNGLHAAERKALTEIFGPAPTPDVTWNGPPARLCLRVAEVRRKLARHLKEKGRLLAKDIRKWDRDLAPTQCQAGPIGKAASSARPRRKALRVA